MAPGIERTLNMLRDPRKRPTHTRPGDELPRGITEFVPELPFDLDEKKFLTNSRSSRRGAAGGPSGTTSEHLTPVLDTLQDAQLLYKLGEQLSRAQAPSSIASAIRLGTCPRNRRRGHIATVGGPHESSAVERFSNMRYPHGRAWSA